MCMLCYSETDETKAKENGAKNYEERREKLEKCRDHQLVKRNNLWNMNRSFCCDATTLETADKCHGVSPEFILDKHRYSNINGINLSEHVTWADVEVKDICIFCAKTEHGQQFIKDNNLELIDNLGTSDLSGFGSMLDWIPILQSEEGDFVLYCANSDNPEYKHITFVSCDDHGRIGFYSCVDEFNADKLIEELKNHQSKLEDFIKNEKNGKMIGWDVYYNEPIKQAMTERGMEIHFG